MCIKEIVNILITCKRVAQMLAQHFLVHIIVTIRRCQAIDRTWACVIPVAAATAFRFFTRLSSISACYMLFLETMTFNSTPPHPLMEYISSTIDNEYSGAYWVKKLYNFIDMNNNILTE